MMTRGHRRARLSHPMRRCLWLAALALAWLTPRPSSAAEPALKEASNAGFEDWSPDGPKGWTLNTHPDLLGSWAASTSAHSGQRALLLRPGQRNQCHAYQRFFAVGPRTLFRATAWVKGKGQAGLALYTYDTKQVFCGTWQGVRVALGEQFQPVSFCYAPDRPDIGFVALVIAVSGKDAEAVFDDVSVERLSLDEIEKVSGCAADLAGEAKAGKWRATEGGAVEVSDGPFTSPALTCRFPPAQTPAKPFDVKTWWRPSGGGSAGAAWAFVSGPKFPLRGGVGHEVKFRHRAENGASVHYKLRYFDEKGQEVKVAGGPCCYHQIGGNRQGSWPWRERAAEVVPPPEVRAGSFEVWALVGSGPVSVADLTVRVAPVSGGAASGGVSVEARDHVLRDARPVALPKEAERAAVAVQVSKERETRVIATSRTTLEVELGTGVTLRGAFDGESFLGIGEVRLGNLVLHSAQAPPWAPLLRGEPTADYERCELVAAEPGSPGHKDGVTLRLRLAAADGSADDMEWHLWPHRIRFVDIDAVGLGYSFAAYSASRTLQGLTDRTVWGLAGTAEGLTVQTQQTYAVDNVFPLGPNGGAVGQGGLRFVHADPLDFQTGPEGSLITYLDHPGFVNKATEGVRWGVRVWDEFRLPWGKRVETSPKYVVFTTARGADVWSAARDSVFELCRAAYGIRRDTPLPMVNVSRLQYSVKPESKTELERIAREWVPEFKRLGFKRIYLGPLWAGIVCGPDRLEIGERHGGEAALKVLCEAAHKADIQVIEWLCPAHLWCESSIFKAHPDYEVRGPNGKPPTMYCWPTLRGVDLTTPHSDYFVESIQSIRSRTGLDGLWLDSYCSFTHFIQTADPQFPLRQGDALWRLHGRLHRLGLITYVEGCACYGIKSNGLPMELDDPEHPVCPAPETFYDSSPYTGPWYEASEKAQAAYLGGGDNYYRFLANKCCVFIYYERVREIPGALDRIAQANHDYNAVVRYMDRRILLPEDRGVQWNCQGKPRALFAFRDFEHGVPDLHSATDVTTGQRLNDLSGRLRAQKGHTYLLEMKAAWWPF